MPEWIIALISFVVGGLIAEVRHWLDRFERFRVMTFERRLSVSQAALSQIYRIRRDVYNGRLSYDEKDGSIKDARTWLEENQLLLDDASRRQMQDLFDAAYNHIDLSDPQIAFHRTWRKTHETIYKGIGSKHLPDTTFKEETEASGESISIRRQKKTPTNKASKGLSIRRLFTYWLLPVWITIAMNLLLFLLILTTSHFDWSISSLSLKHFLPFSEIIIVVLYLFYYLIPIWPLKTGIATMTILATIFIVASGKYGNLAPPIRAYIDETFNIDYFGIGMTAFGLAVAFLAIYQEQKNRERK